MFQKICVIIAVSVLCTVISATTPVDKNEQPIVETSLGKLKGNVLESRLGRLFYSFRGIRYGKPPVGDLRFKVFFNNFVI